MKNLSLLALICLIFTNVAATSSKPSSTSLVATFDDVLSVSSGVRSDGGGSYTNGVGAVTAVFQGNGHFVFSSGSRAVNFTYSFGLDSQSPLLANDSPITAKARTFPINASGYVPMQNMTPNSGQCLGLTWEYSIPNGFTRNVSYHYGTGDQSQTAYVTVLYDGLSWTLQSTDMNNCSGGGTLYDNAGVVKDSKTAKGKTTTISNGRYFMPFKLTLTRL